MYLCSPCIPSWHGQRQLYLFYIMPEAYLEVLINYLKDLSLKILADVQWKTGNITKCTWKNEKKNIGRRADVS